MSVRLNRRLVAVLVVGGWLVASSWFASGLSRAGEPAEDDGKIKEDLRDQIEQELLKAELRKEERMRRSLVLTEKGKKYLQTQRYELARDTFKEAMLLDAENEQARMGYKEAMQYLAADPEAAIIERLQQQAAIEQKSSIAEAEQKLAQVRERVEKAFQPVRSEVLEARADQISRYLTLLDEAQTALTQAELRVTSISATVDVQAYEGEIQELRTRVRTRIPELQDQLKTIQQEAALRAQERQKKMIQEIEERKQKMMLDRAQEFSDLQQYKSAEKIIEEVQRMNPGDDRLEQLLREVQRLHRIKRWEVIRDRISERRRLSMQNIERATIAEVSPEQRIRYPRDWDALIRKRQLDKEKGEMVDEPTREVLQKLGQAIDVTFDANRLTEVISFLRTRTNIDILIDNTLDEDVREQEVSLSFQNTRVENILYWIMRQTGLAYDIRRGAIFITEPDRLRGAIETEVYDVRDIAFAVADASPMPAEDDDDDDFVDDDFDDMDRIFLDEIVRRVLSEDFMSDDAEVIFEEGSGMLTVRNTPDAHRRLKELLGKLRAAQAIQVSVSARFLTLRDDFWEEFSSDFYDFNNYYTPALEFGVSDNSPVKWGAMNNAMGRHLGGAPDVPDFLGPTQVGKTAFELNDGGTPGIPSLGDAQHWGNRLFDPGRHFNDLRGTMTNGIFSGTGLVSTLGQNLGGGQNFGDDAGFMFHVKQTGWLGPLQSQWFIRAVRMSQKADLMFTPHLVTYNNRYAWIRIKRHIQYIYTWRRAAAGEGLEMVRQWLHLGSSLEVRPTVSADKKYITVDIYPRIEDLNPPGQGATEVPSQDRRVMQEFFMTPFGPQLVATYPIELPQIFYHDTHTVAIVPDGGAVLLNGLGININLRQRRGVPLLQDLPMVGNIFSNRAYQKEKRNYNVLLNARMILLDEEEAKQTRAP